MSVTSEGWNHEYAGFAFGVVPAAGDGGTLGGDNRQAIAACSAPVGERPMVDGVAVRDQAGAPGDLPAIVVTDQASGAWMTLYYDAPSESIARARASCFGAQLVLLRTLTGDERRDARWSSVVFS